MIELTNLTEQTLQPGQSLIFNEAILHSGNCECWRKGTGVVKMRRNGIYAASFYANIGGLTAATPVQLSLSLGPGAILNETTAISVPAATTDRNNVARSTRIKNCCGDYDTISIVNSGTDPVVVGANSVLILEPRS